MPLDPIDNHTTQKCNEIEGRFHWKINQHVRCFHYASLFPKGIWKYVAESEICFFLKCFEIPVQCFTTPKMFDHFWERLPVLNQQWGILVTNLSSSSFLDSSRNMDGFIRSTCSQPQMKHRHREMRPAMGSLSHHSEQKGVRFPWFVRFPIFS